MFVRWKSRVLTGSRRTPHCHHEGAAVNLTPVVVKSVREGDRIRQKVILRVSAPIRACCISDPIVRAEWWAHVEQHLSGRGLSPGQQAWVTKRLALMVPRLTAQELEVARLWRQERHYAFTLAQREALLAELFKRTAVQTSRPRVSLANVKTCDLADLAAVLGVQWPANANDLQKAYRRKVREVHPDLGGSEDEAKVVNLAFERLKVAGGRVQRPYGT
jgi:hypothetical protein